jgi:hypothetical protein
MQYHALRSSGASTEEMSALSENHLAGAREFYRRQLAVSFRYSREFSQPLGSVAEALVDTPEFDTVVRDCTVGSFECARRLAEIAVVRLDRLSIQGTEAPGSHIEPAKADIAAARPWWRDLLNYERGCFLQSATTAEGPPTNRPRRGVSSVCMNFAWAVPEIVEHLKSGRPITDDLLRTITLLFARTADGRVCVVEVGSAVERVFRATNGLRTVEQIAAAAGENVEETTEVLKALAGIGAVVLAMSSEEMARLIEARENRR